MICVIFHDFPGLEMVLLNSMTFHDRGNPALCTGIRCLKKCFRSKRNGANLVDFFVPFFCHNFFENFSVALHKPSDATQHNSLLFTDSN